MFDARSINEPCCTECSLTGATCGTAMLGDAPAPPPPPPPASPPPPPAAQAPPPPPIAPFFYPPTGFYPQEAAVEFVGPDFAQQLVDLAAKQAEQAPDRSERRRRGDGVASTASRFAPLAEVGSFVLLLFLALSRGGH